ncbi:MAG: condensation domain-containing protein [Planctomycetota bacterium]
MPASDDITHASAGQVLSRMPLSLPQMEIMLSATQSADANCAYNEITTLVVHGPIDEQRLRDTLQQLSRRHEMLRCHLSEDAQHMVILDSVTLSMRVEDLTHLQHSQADFDAHMRRVFQEMGSTPFDLMRGPVKGQGR